MRTKPNANVRKILRMGKYRYGNTLDVNTLAQLNRRIRNLDVHGNFNRTDPEGKPLYNLTVYTYA
jgi:hypothetical protein